MKVSTHHAPSYEVHKSPFSPCSNEYINSNNVEKLLLNVSNLLEESERKGFFHSSLIVLVQPGKKDTVRLSYWLA